MGRRDPDGDERLRRLAGVSEHVLDGLVSACARPEVRPGRPCRYPLATQVLVLLVKLRLDLPYRALEVISGIDAVTASRMVRRLLMRLRAVALAGRTKASRFYLVDTTTVRVRASQGIYYSGYKHHRGVKTQVLADEQRIIHHLSAAYPARVHDKVIWERTARQVQPLLGRPVLADKAYAGVQLEGKGLIRPLRRNEWAYRLQPVQAKAFNRELSRHRARIEHVMASLKRFRILGNRFSLVLEWYPAVMKTAALIHNMEQVAA